MSSPPIPNPSQPLQRGASPPARGEGREFRTAIIGIGSPFGEDQAGWEAADVMAGEDWVRKRRKAGKLALMKLDRPGLCLLDSMKGFDHVILIDAVLSSKHSPGMLLPLKPEELQEAAAFPASTHGIGVAEALAMGEALGELPRRLEIWGIVVPALE